MKHPFNCQKYEFDWQKMQFLPFFQCFRISKKDIRWKSRIANLQYALRQKLHITTANKTKNIQKYFKISNETNIKILHFILMPSDKFRIKIIWLIWLLIFRTFTLKQTMEALPFHQRNYDGWKLLHLLIFLYPPETL